MNSENSVFEPRRYTEPEEALEYLQEIYQEQTRILREGFEAYVKSGCPSGHPRIRAFYPYIRLETDNTQRQDTRLSYGFVPTPGVYETTVTRPDLFDHYYKDQMALLLKNHGVPIEIGLSGTPIPLHFALGDQYMVDEALGPEAVRHVAQTFDQPDLMNLDDSIADCKQNLTAPGQPRPLALFTAQRVDLSLMRLKHYSGTSAEHFQNYVIFTNYAFYIDQFLNYAKRLMTAPEKGQRDNPAYQEYACLVEPGNVITWNENVTLPENRPETGRPPSRTPQMPAYHLKRLDGSGITLINIGVGPSNAKTITDHVAVLRPHAWLMLGHCAGLRNSQNIGDYVLAHAYLREDHILDELLPPSIPIPALAEIQMALETAVSDTTGFEGYDLKKIMRTGTVATIDDRNWELRSSPQENHRFSMSRAIALDMESGTIASNGFRFRVPYGTLLCVSDKPLHGQVKLPGMADKFYRERVEQHLHIGLLAMTMLRHYGPDKLHSRKLRSFNEVAFQ